MRADERHAAVAYTYAWWLTGDDAEADAARRRALTVTGPTGGGSGSDDTLVGLVGGVRRHLADRQVMCPASELALLHDGLGVPLEPAGRLAGISEHEIAVQLAHGRLEALLETVQEEFAHPQRLGGLAVANPPDVAHARQCESCGRARALLDRGRAELRQVVKLESPAEPSGASETASPTGRRAALLVAVAGVLTACAVAAVVLTSAGAGATALSDPPSTREEPTCRCSP